MAPPGSPSHYDDTKERLARIEEQLSGLTRSVDRLYKILGWFGAVVGTALIAAVLKPALGGGLAAVAAGLVR